MAVDAGGAGGGGGMETCLKRVKHSALLALAAGYSVQRASHDESLDGCDIRELWIDGFPVFAFAGRLIGDEYVIVAAGGRYGADLTGIGLELAEREARSQGAKTVAFQTVRRGLVKKSERCGYQVAGWIIRKGL